MAAVSPFTGKPKLPPKPDVPNNVHGYKVDNETDVSVNKHFCSGETILSNCSQRLEFDNNLAANANNANNNNNNEDEETDHHHPIVLMRDATTTKQQTLNNSSIVKKNEKPPLLPKPYAKITSTSTVTATTTSMNVINRATTITSHLSSLSSLLDDGHCDDRKTGNAIIDSGGVGGGAGKTQIMSEFVNSSSSSNNKRIIGENGRNNINTTNNNNNNSNNPFNIIEESLNSNDGYFITSTEYDDDRQPLLLGTTSASAAIAYASSSDIDNYHHALLSTTSIVGGGNREQQHNSSSSSKSKYFSSSYFHFVKSNTSVQSSIGASLLYSTDSYEFIDNSSNSSSSGSLGGGGNSNNIITDNNNSSSSLNCGKILLEIKEKSATVAAATIAAAPVSSGSSDISAASNRIIMNLSRSSSSISGASDSSSSSILKISPRDDDSTVIVASSGVAKNSDDNDSTIIDEDCNSNNSSHSVSRRIKSWFSSFGKGGNSGGGGGGSNNSSIRRRNKKRDSTFYLDSDDSSIPPIDTDVDQEDSSNNNNNNNVQIGDLISFDPPDYDGSNEQVDNRIASAATTGRSLVEQDVADVRTTSSSSSISGGTTDNNNDDDNEKKIKISKQNDGIGGAAVVDQDRDDDLIKNLIVDKRKRKAYLVVRELISSEKVFLDVLKLLSHDFKQFVCPTTTTTPHAVIDYPLAAADASATTATGGIVIAENEFAKIINYLPQLLSFNEDLLRDLETRLEAWLTYPKISDIIVKKGPFLKLYSTYIQHFEKQCNLLDEYCAKYPRFMRAVKEFEMTERCKKLTVKHYMLKPVQRIPQYRLLLQDYLDQQDGDSIDYKDTEEALRIVCDVANHANRCIELDAHTSKLLELQSHLGNYELIKPGREFIRSGELYKLSRKGLQMRYFILLNDCLLYTSYYGSTTSLKVNYELPLTGMKICIPQIEDYHNEFSIITIARSFTLVARSDNEREKWVKALHDTIKEHNKRQLSFVGHKLLIDGLLSQPLNLGKEAPIWVPDHRVTMCQSCTAEFKVTFRRHHCRACGKVVCGICSDNKAPLQYMNFQVARVCDDCYQYLLKEFEQSPDIFDNVKKQLRLIDDADAISMLKTIKSSFKKHESDTSRKLRKHIPLRLKEVTANDSGSKMSGWLYRKTRRAWKRYWFVLKEQVLYAYKASEDVRALETIPVLGYIVETFRHSSTYEDIDSNCVFQLAHANQQPLVFHAENESIADRWIIALQEATNLN